MTDVKTLSSLYKGEAHMLAILSLIPIIVALCLMTFAKQKASIALLCSWVVAVLIAVVVWNMDIAHAMAWTVSGFLQALPILIIIFGSIFMLNILVEFKYIKTIGNGFDGITQDRRIQIIIVAWFFGAFIEGAAGFGTPGAIAAPLMVALGIPVFLAALASLIANATPVLFGAAGTPPTAGFASIATTVDYLYESGIIAAYSGAVAHQMHYRVTLLNILPGSLVPFLIIASVVARDGRGEGIKNAVKIFPLCLLAGFAFTIPQWAASFLGPNIPSLVGGLVGMIIFLIAVKNGFLVPKDVYRFQNDPIKEELQIKEEPQKKDTDLSLLNAWSPYILIVAMLVLTRLPWLNMAPILNPAGAANAHVSILGIFGFSGINWTFNPLWNPGVFPFIPVTILFICINLYKKRTTGKVVKNLATTTVKQLKHAALALFFGVALVQIMLQTNFTDPGANASMTAVLAVALGDLFGGAYLVIAPIIGILGAFVSGSHTVSNVMFMGLQLDTALSLDLPIVMILAAQMSGGAIGNMTAINNVVAVVATTGYKGNESKLFGAAAIPMFIYSLFVSILLYVFLAIGMIWIA